MIAAEMLRRLSTSGLDGEPMNDCRNAEYVSLMRRCDSAAMVPNTSDDLPDPDTPVNTVSRRFGISMLTSLRLFSRAPWTRIRSWLSAGCWLGEVMFALVSPGTDGWHAGRSPSTGRISPRFRRLESDVPVSGDCATRVTRSPGVG